MEERGIEEGLYYSDYEVLRPWGESEDGEEEGESGEGEEVGGGTGEEVAEGENWGTEGYA